MQVFGSLGFGLSGFRKFAQNTNTPKLAKVCLAKVGHDSCAVLIKKFHQNPLSSKNQFHQKPLSLKIPLKGDRTKQNWGAKNNMVPIFEYVVFWVSTGLHAEHRQKAGI